MISFRIKAEWKKVGNKNLHVVSEVLLSRYLYLYRHRLIYLSLDILINFDINSDIDIYR